MRPVAVIGIGKTAFGAFPDRDLRSLAVEAGEKCLADAHVSPSQVEAFYLGNFAGPSFVGQNHLAPYIAGAMGINGVPCTRFEAACASRRELSRAAPRVARIAGPHAFVKRGKRRSGRRPAKRVRLGPHPIQSSSSSV